MSSSAQPPVPPSRPYDLFAALLSYLVPGLGQIYQGRVGKGVLFMVSLLGMFFLGMHLGNWSNVYLPEPRNRPAAPDEFTNKVRRLGSAIVNDRLAFAGQFWIGVAAWPAILQYNDKWFFSEKSDPALYKFQKMPPEDELNRLQSAGDKSWDLGWVYTVIAGVLNILVIYDALAGPAFQRVEERKDTSPAREAVAA
jgi:hypothetical protein